MGSEIGSDDYAGEMGGNAAASAEAATAVVVVEAAMVRRLSVGWSTC